jgi:CBS domain-containing protein
MRFALHFLYSSIPRLFGHTTAVFASWAKRVIAIRGIAQGKGPDAKVRDVMTEDIKYCFDDEEIEEVTRNMAAIQVRRLPVLNRDKRLVGILSLGDIAIGPDGKRAGDALRGISRPGGDHTQTG